MKRLSDEFLREVSTGEVYPTLEARLQMARELLAARRVIEVSRECAEGENEYHEAMRRYEAAGKGAGSDDTVE